jgi:PD-(D/E)XK nuclease superfamily
MNKRKDCPQCGAELLEDAWENVQETEDGGVMVDSYAAYVCREKCGFVKRMEDLPKAIAQQGDDRILLSYPNDQARILDTRDSILWPLMNVDSILGRGYWEDYRGNHDIEMVLESARESDAAFIETPNLFQFATSELSQDAFLCWLLAWSQDLYKSVDRPLHEAAVHFVKEIFKLHRLPLPNIKTIEIKRQFKSLDILAIINDTYVILIEDKTFTKNHSDQLMRYRQSVKSVYPKHIQLPIYYKITDQSHYRSVERAGYIPFKRKGMLDVLKNGKDNGVENTIFLDYYHHLKKIDDRIHAFQTAPVSEWDAFAWQGFFQKVQEDINGDWGYVSNPKGGFWGFWWKSEGDGTNHYFQLEEERLCVKIKNEVDSEQGREFLLKSVEKILVKSEERNLSLEKPARLRKGKTMTIAERLQYIQKNPDGTVDVKATVRELKRY